MKRIPETSDMEKQQTHEWEEAQKICISTNLVIAARKLLQFLEAVDSNGKLYDGPILEKSVFRFATWKTMELFGRILDPGCVVVSSIEGASKKQTEEIWKRMYPEEPYELDFINHFKNDTQNRSVTLPSTNYDLISSVKRKKLFYQKVGRTTMTDDFYLEGAVERYKGFLHLIRRNREMKSKNFCVPTKDIDLIWHSHQLHPLSYYKDAMGLVGLVLDHDDDTNQGKGGKLDVGFKRTAKQWEEMFGSQYLSAKNMSAGMEGKKADDIARCVDVPCSGDCLDCRGKSGMGGLTMEPIEPSVAVSTTPQRMLVVNT